MVWIVGFAFQIHCYLIYRLATRFVCCKGTILFQLLLLGYSENLGTKYRSYGNRGKIIKKHTFQIKC